MYWNSSNVTEFCLSYTTEFQSVLFFHIYDCLCIPCLRGIFAFGNAYEVLSKSHKYFIFGRHILSLIIKSFLCHSFFPHL